jgi:hypothetical protein
MNGNENVTAKKSRVLKSHARPTIGMFVLAVAGVLLLTTSESRIRFLLLSCSRVSHVMIASVANGFAANFLARARC